jgi:hypothetical protein
MIMMTIIMLMVMQVIMAPGALEKLKKIMTVDGLYDNNLCKDGHKNDKYLLSEIIE